MELRPIPVTVDDAWLAKEVATTETAFKSIGHLIAKKLAAGEPVHFTDEHVNYGIRCHSAAVELQHWRALGAKVLDIIDNDKTSGEDVSCFWSQVTDLEDTFRKLLGRAK